MVDSCLSPWRLWCTFLSLACHSATSLFTYFGYLFILFIFFIFFNQTAPSAIRMKLYFLAAFCSVLLYEKIYFNIQFANYFSNKRKGIFFSKLIGRGVDWLPVAEQRVWILSGLTLFLVCTQTCNRALITVNTCWPHTNFWAEPLGPPLFPDKSGRFSITTATG